MNEEKIREIFDLCLRVSSETTAHVNFDYTACDDISRVYIYVFNDAGEIVKHFSLCQFYDFESESQNYENAKKCLLELLINGRCPLNSIQNGKTVPGMGDKSDAIYCFFKQLKEPVYEREDTGSTETD